ncbi:MAG: hypothetical protein IT221_12640 [Fluviicola sp.]|nr:hypothetical protein [Fluviicola sp.]
MKHLFLISIFLISSLISFAQGIRKVLPFNEFGASVNYSIPLSRDHYHFSGNIGGGVIANYSFKPASKINPVVGLSYQFLKYSVQSIPSDLGYYKDIDVSNHLLNISYAVRFQLGEKQRLLFEPGVFGGIHFGGTIQGTTDNSNSNGQVYSNTSDGIMSGFYAGLSFAVGTQFSLSKGKIIGFAKCNAGTGNTKYAPETPNETAVYFGFFPECSVVYQLP